MCRLQNYKLLLANYVATMSTPKQNQVSLSPSSGLLLAHAPAGCLDEALKTGNRNTE